MLKESEKGQHYKLSRVKKAKYEQRKLRVSQTNGYNIMIIMGLVLPTRHNYKKRKSVVTEKEKQL